MLSAAEWWCTVHLWMFFGHQRVQHSVAVTVVSVLRAGAPSVHLQRLLGAAGVGMSGRPGTVYCRFQQNSGPILPTWGL